MKAVNLVRVDFRLIHGQVITKWKNVIHTTRIVIIDDGLADDDFMADIYVAAAPPGVKVDVVREDEFMAKEAEGEYEEGSILVLLKKVDTLKRLADKGMLFPEIQVGGLGGGAGRKQIVTGITISEPEVETLKELAGKGSKIYFQVTPEEKKVQFKG